MNAAQRQMIDANRLQLQSETRNMRSNLDFGDTTRLASPETAISNIDASRYTLSVDLARC